ncbi:MAG: hypothetical protein ABR555_15395, partial [Pyrinomonadaceae bacterium]
MLFLERRRVSERLSSSMCGGGFAAPQRIQQQQVRQQTRGFERQQARQQTRGLEREQAHQQARGFERQQA